MARGTVRLTFPETLIQEPVIYRLGQEFKVVTNIFRASVGEKNAWMILELEGDSGEIERSREYVESLGIQVEDVTEPEG
jgi:ABC-type methionine transport system ATPase subunit